MKSLTRIFLTGLGTILPLVLTVYLLYWFNYDGTFTWSGDTADRV